MFRCSDLPTFLKSEIVAKSYTTILIRQRKASNIPYITRVDWCHTNFPWYLFQMLGLVLVFDRLAKDPSSIFCTIWIWPLSMTSESWIPDQGGISGAWCIDCIYSVHKNVKTLFSWLFFTTIIWIFLWLIPIRAHSSDDEGSSSSASSSPLIRRFILWLASAKTKTQRKEMWISRNSIL